MTQPPEKKLQSVDVFQVMGHVERLTRSLPEG